MSLFRLEGNVWETEREKDETEEEEMGWKRTIEGHGGVRKRAGSGHSNREREGSRPSLSLTPFPLPTPHFPVSFHRFCGRRRQACQGRRRRRRGEEKRTPNARIMDESGNDGEERAVGTLSHLHALSLSLTDERGKDIRYHREKLNSL